ncbi:ArdC family protein [Bacillus cereus group sp. BfR-BA-01330]
MTQIPYRGINVWLLDLGGYATFKQISDAGERVRGIK